MHLSIRLAAIPLVCCSFFPVETRAQSEADTNRRVFETVVVTAQKRAQRINEVPASLTTVSTDDILASSGNDLRSVFEKIPGATFIGLGFSGNNSVSLRGLGGLATFGPYDSVVGFTLDEQVIPLRSFDALLLDVDRIEILKGPQGTLYGRSAIGGAVNIVTRELTEDWNGQLSAEGGENGHLSIKGAGGGALSEALIGRAAVRYSKYDGDIANTLTKQDTNQAEELSARISGKWRFDDQGFLQLAYQIAREDLYPTGDLLLSAPNYPTAALSGLNRADRDSDRLTARFETDFSGTKLIALAAYEKTEIGNNFDLTDSILTPAAFGIPAEFTTDPSNDRSITNTDEKAVSIEVRLQSDTGSTIDWLVGASYIDFSFDRDLSRRSIIPNFNTDEVSSNSNETIGLFADITFSLSSRIRIGGGFRIARDELEYRGVTDFSGPLAAMPRFSEADSMSDDYLVGNLHLSYDLADAQLFARAARGYASGGYGEFAANALVGRPIDPFAPSTSNSIEIGIRGGKPLFSYHAAMFHNDVTDGQTYQFDAPTFSNVAENLDFRAYGIETELSTELTAWARIDLNMALLEADFDDVPASSLSGASDNNRVPLTPEFTLSARLSGAVAVTNIGPVQRATYSISITHISDRAADPANSTLLDDYTLIDLYLGAKLGNVEIYAFGSNISDEIAVLYGQNFGTADTPIPTANINRGRVLGFGIATEF